MLVIQRIEIFKAGAGCYKLCITYLEDYFQILLKFRTKQSDLQKSYLDQLWSYIR